MTIAKRLTILLALPLVAMPGLACFMYAQMAAAESHSRLVSESLVPSLALLGNLSRTVENLRVNVRSHLLATNEPDQARAKATFNAAAAEANEPHLRSLFAAESWERLRQYAQAYAFEEYQRLVEQATRNSSIL
jgi:hypothetical protein